MRRNTVTVMRNLAFQNPATILGILFFFITGISAGVFTELMMTPQIKAEIAEYLNETLFWESLSGSDLPGIFLQSIRSNLGLLLIICLSGLSAIGFPAAVAVIAYKGMALGFSSALLIESMSFKGVTVIGLTMLPSNLILVPAFLIAAVCAVNMARSTIKSRRTGIKKSLSINTGPYLFIHLILMVCMVAGCLIESFICPILLQLLG